MNQPDVPISGDAPSIVNTASRADLIPSGTVAHIPVAVTEAYLSNLIQNPHRGLQELIDNALDADARQIAVSFTRDDLMAIKTVKVHDDGDGMSRARAASSFGSLGDSWKNTSPLTASGRRRRGNKGQGRWSAFALGNEVTWTSVSATADRQGRESTTIVGERRHLDGFEISSEAVSPETPTGTVALIRDILPKAQQLDSAFERDKLTQVYAFTLRRQPSLSIRIDGECLDPSTVIKETYVETIDIDHPDVSIPNGAVRLSVVHWKKNVKGIRPMIVLADGSGEALHDHEDFVPHAPWHYSAFLCWEGFAARKENLVLPAVWDDELRQVVDAGLAALRTHIATKKATARTQILQSWKDEGSYPYQGPPRGPMEEAERDLFDLVAVAAAPSIDASDQKGRRFALRMLREAVTRDPTALTDVLEQVLDLRDDELKDLAEILQRTTLSALVGAGRQVVHRLDILDGLHTLIHDPVFSPKVAEKKHLHEIVAAEPWVFGDEYTTAVSEGALTKVLRSHQRILGPERVLVDPSLPGPRPQVDGIDGRVDLMLSRVSPVDTDTRQHLIVELKRPAVTLGLDEIVQLEKYAFEIRNDRRFHGLNVRWDFLLIGARMNSHAAEKAADFERSARPNFRIRVVTWENLIHERRHQMKFIQNALSMNTTTSGGLEEIRRLHSAHLPEDLLSEDDQVSSAS